MCTKGRLRSYFKKNILHQLEAMGLIRMVVLHEPMTDEKERAEAIRKAKIYTIRRERAALKAAPRNGPRPHVEPAEPNFVVQSYAWTLHDSAIPDERSITSRIHGPDNPTQAWEKAEALEAKRLEAEADEAEAIRVRKERRKARYQSEAEAYKAERQRLQDAGLWEAFLADKAQQERRNMAIANVRKYAEATGEDVSRWFQELGVREAESRGIGKGAMFGLQRDFTQEESDDLEAEVYRQEQAALLEREREAERAGHGVKKAKPQRKEDAPFGLRPDAWEQMNRSRVEEGAEVDKQRLAHAKETYPTFPVDAAWREQLAANIAPGSDSPFWLKPKSTLFARAIGGHDPHATAAATTSLDRRPPPRPAGVSGVQTAASSTATMATGQRHEEREWARDKMEWSRSLPAAAARTGNRGHDQRSRTFGRR